MNEVIKAAAVGILATILALTVKKDNPAGAYLVTIGAGLTVLWLAIDTLSPVKRFLDELSEAANLSPAILSPLFKALGISIITKVAAEACRDAKEGAIGAYVEIAGSAVALYVSLPLLSSAFAAVKALLEI